MKNDMFRVALYIEEHGRQLIPADQAGDPHKAKRMKQSRRKPRRP